MPGLKRDYYLKIGQQASRLKFIWKRRYNAEK